MNRFEMISAEQIPDPITQIEGYSKRDSYGFVSTKDVLSSFEAAGWVPSSTSIGRVNKPERQGFQKHLIRLQHPDHLEIPGLTSSNRARTARTAEFPRWD